jgi:hypothetical protein
MLHTYIQVSQALIHCTMVIQLEMRASIGSKGKLSKGKDSDVVYERDLDELRPPGRLAVQFASALGPAVHAYPS